MEPRVSGPMIATALLLLSSAGPAAEPRDYAPRRQERLAMVRQQIEARGIENPRVLEAMRTVPRHLFVPEEARPWAYRDHPLAIGYRQTISQPYIVALMTELLSPEAGDKVLEIGTGSGYQAAVLSLLVDQVFSIEIVEPLARRATAELVALGYDNVMVIAGDGYRGLPDEAPFDGIIVTAAPPYIPEPLVEQLAPGGRMVVPVGEDYQELQLLVKSAGGVEVRRVIPVRFVPMTGEVQKRPRPKDR
jgi:protein-L-isoaspartate(D-aspartate) O-methyltransferase